MEIDAREMLRLCGITNEEEISNYAWMLNQGLSDEQHRVKISNIFEILNDVVNEFQILNVLDIQKIRKASRLIEKLVVIKEQSTDSVMAEIEAKQNDPDAPIYRYHLKEFPTLMKATEGIGKGFYLITADPNIGKTAFLCHLTNDLLATNEGDTIKVLFISLDDDKDDIIKRLIANNTYYIGRNTLTASTINASGRYYDFYDEVEKKWKVNPKATELKKMATEIVKANIESKRLFITDATHSMNSLRNAVVEVGTENLIVIIDGLYNLRTDLTGNEKDEHISKGVKQMTKDFKIPFFCVKELKKPSEGIRKRITIHDLKGSGDWGYDATFVATLQQDEGRIKMSYEKNKKSDYKCRPIYYNFIPAKNIYQELTEDKQ